MLGLMILTDDAAIARLAQNCGVDRVFIDLEYINKRERQLGRNSVLSHHHIENIPAIREILSTTKLLVRTNPLYYPEAKQDILRAVEYGADIIMLPMVSEVEQVLELVKIVDGRAKVCVMVETPQAVAHLNEILDVPGVDEIFVGLNDLHIGMGLSFMFEVLSVGVMDHIAEICHEKNMPFGFGGIAKIGQGELPSEYIIAEHYRLGSSGVILSRAFKNCFNEEGRMSLNFNFAEEIAKIRGRERVCEGFSPLDFNENKERVKTIVQKLIEKQL